MQIQVDPSQNINLTVIDMDLDRNGTYGCNDWMYAYNQLRSVTLCGRRTNEKLTTLRTNSIFMKFQSNSQVNKKGFWIYYEGKPQWYVHLLYSLHTNSSSLYTNIFKLTRIALCERAKYKYQFIFCNKHHYLKLELYTDIDYYTSYSFCFW